MEVRVQRWREVDIPELAKLAYATLAATHQGDPTTAWLENWLDTLEFDSPPVVVQARVERRLVGWLLLFVHDGKRAEINPWALNGHPFISPRENRQQVASQLIKETIGYAEKQGLSKIELSFRHEREPTRTSDKFKSLYESLGLRLITETAIMSCVLAELDFENAQIPFEVKRLTDVDESELYQCYYQTFNTGQDRFFFDQTEEERQAFFNLTFSRSKPLNEETSLVIMKNQQILGFSLVRPTHGEENCHLWMFGIHPDYRRKGLGKSFLQHIMKSAQNGFRTMSVACELTNQPAFKLYRNQGFKEEFSKIEYSWTTR